MKKIDLTQHIHESNLIENINNQAFDIQSLKAWKQLIRAKTLDQPIVCQTQKTITELQTDLMTSERGYYRNASQINVTVGGRIAPSWTMVQHLMDNWLLVMKENWKKLDPIEMHVRFEQIHPFVDGNGRTGRMLLWWHELKLGQQPTLFLDQEKFTVYYLLFKELA